MMDSSDKNTNTVINMILLFKIINHTDYHRLNHKTW